jgi:hypothetical protein
MRNPTAEILDADVDRLGSAVSELLSYIGNSKRISSPRDPGHQISPNAMAVSPHGHWAVGP